MENGFLAEVASALVPNYLELFNWGDIWTRPLEEGSAFEWTALAAIVSQAEKNGWKYSFPILRYSWGRDFFTVRNQIPKQFGAQPGYSSQLIDQNLKYRFLQSLVPKVELSKANLFYSLFREGCSYHEVMSNQDYNERPDIMFIPGRPKSDFPMLIRRDTCVDFQFCFNDGLEVFGKLRVLQSPIVRCIERHPEGASVPVHGIVECSVNKSLAVATGQLEGYINLFSTPLTESSVFLVTGNELPECRWNKFSIPLYTADTLLIENSFRGFADETLSLFGLI
ncbi:hypothetical protein IQ265_04015 [Nodosilinea sp. LEGE 06152]|uniref:hypothetical protein n=1 Tax=Nodosilinea sp. LEGE 06152 TaxID=2777966 RepID=UPI00188236AF|nr:hypothetical protein [Nodosilinea sp. LEGE 06152]MBE9156001.1 hypothetical protein [Nodosilinea sp. LEGE 06152]